LKKYIYILVKREISIDFHNYLEELFFF